MYRLQKIIKFKEVVQTIFVIKMKTNVKKLKKNVKQKREMRNTPYTEYDK